MAFLGTFGARQSVFQNSHVTQTNLCQRRPKTVRGRRKTRRVARITKLARTPPEPQTPSAYYPRTAKVHFGATSEFAPATRMANPDVQKPLRGW